jgi:hypothetical protein
MRDCVKYARSNEDEGIHLFPQAGFNTGIRTTLRMTTMSDTQNAFDFDYAIGALEVTACDLVVTTPQSLDPMADETVRKVLTLLKEQHGTDAAFVAELHDDTSVRPTAVLSARGGLHDDASGDVYVLAVCRQVFGPFARCFIRVPVLLADGRNYGTLYAPCHGMKDEDRRRDVALMEMTAQLTARLVDARRAPARAKTVVSHAQPQPA